MKNILNNILLMLLALNVSISARSQDQDVDEKIVENNVGGFLEGTLVWTPWGTRAIQRLSVNDRVLSFDLKTGQTVESKVLDIVVFQVNSIIELKVDGQTIYLNPFHKFYSPATNAWIMAKDLVEEKDAILTKDGRVVTVQAKREILGKRQVYDITVEKNANYFVTNSSLLVHNFAIVIPIVTWVIGEGVVWVTGAALAAALAYAAADYIMEKNDGTPKCNKAQNKQFDDATRGLTPEEKRRVHDMVSGCNFGYQEIKTIADEIKQSRRNPPSGGGY